MTPEQQAAYVMSQVVCAQAEIAGMQADNDVLLANGFTPRYRKVHFDEIVVRYGIHHNAVIGTFRT